MNDLISRQAAIDALSSIGSVSTEADRKYARSIFEALPPVQSDLPEWAQKVEECRKNAPECIHNPLAWALYQVWKEYDR